MIKQLGGTRAVPKPNSAVASEAIELFTFLGGSNKEGIKLLQEMRDVQSHNEKVLSEATAAIVEASRLQVSVEKAQKALDAESQKARSALDKREDNLAKGHVALDHKKNLDDNYLKSQNASLTKREKELGELDSSFVLRERALKDGNNQVFAREKAVKKEQAANSAARLLLDQRTARIKAAVEG